MENYYAKDSAHLQEDTRRGRTLGEEARRIYYNFMKNKWVPYLKENGIKSIDEIDPPLLARFQDKLLNKEIKPQTINHYMSYISQVFDHLIIEGGADINPFKNLMSLKVGKDSRKERGCFEINKLYGIFNRRWEDKLSRLLCLLIYTTNMRNIEIGHLQVKDIIKIDKYHFIDIPKSKSKNGVRIVPLHDLVYKELIKYIAQNNKTDNDYIFKSNNAKRAITTIWRNAYVEIGKLLGYDEEKLKAENITFYSGRHFWKTLMNSQELGDVEEVFMGHKVSEDVAKRYNHRDKQGKEKIIKKVKEVFTILDQKLFIVKKNRRPC
jgi:integrase